MFGEWEPIETAPKGNPDKEYSHERSGPRVLLKSASGNIFIGRVEYSYKKRLESWKDDFGRTVFWEPIKWMHLPKE